MKNDPFACGAQTAAAPDCTLSIVVPAFNEEEALSAFHRRLLASLSKVQGGWKILHVGDRSTDEAPRVLRKMQAIEPAVGLARLSCNFGLPTLIVTTLLLGGLQLMATGILGEYLDRLFIETKRRPLYLFDDCRAGQPSAARA